MKGVKDQIIQQLDYFTYIKGQSKVFLEAVEYDALTVAVAFDSLQTEQRAQKLEKILDSYKGDDRIHFIELIKTLNKMLIGMVDDYGDHLGEIYMEINSNSKKTGQYFTPYHVSKMMARVVLGEKWDKEKILTINEPACGSGGMVVAAADLCNELGINYASEAFAIAGDIDRNCVMMSYLQISYTGMPAVVLWQDSLTQETWDSFITPAFALQYNKFASVLDDLRGHEM